MSKSPNSEQSIFEQALSLGSGDACDAYLQEVCRDDAGLRARVEWLLQAHEAAGGFLRDKTAQLSPAEIVSASPERPGISIGHYKLRERIGEGGCGVVYVAEQEVPIRRRVAVKVIKLGMDTRSVVARFEAERQALAMMDHPNIAKVLDAGATETGRPYFVMELVRGIKITEYCDQNHLSTRERLELFMQVCRAVQHAHQKGIIHRDLKPSNILVTLHDGVPVPKVIDFGIAKATEGRLTDLTIYTELHQLIGTPAYMSPEQAEMSGLDIDTRSDIYSLGVLLYELLTGKTPFDAQQLLAAGLDEIRRTIREKEPVRPSTRLSTMIVGELTATAQRRGSDAPRLVHLVRGDLDWIVMKCLEKDRTRRYETANGLATDVHRHLNQEPVGARPPSSLYRFQKFLRRNKLAVTATGAVLLSLVLGMATTTWQAVRATHSSLRAAMNEQNARDAQRQADREKRDAQRLLYVANMNLAQQSWEQNNLARLQQLLADTESSPDRGFEWFYWQRRTHLAVKVLWGHSAHVTSVAFSPDGQAMVTGSSDKLAKVWDTAKWEEILPLRGHTSGILAVAWSPDSQRIASASSDETVRVWEASSGRSMLTVRGHTNTVWSVAWSPDSRRIVTGGRDGTARVWDAVTGQPLATFQGHHASVRSVAWSPDGEWIVSGCGDSESHVGDPIGDNTATVWDAAGGKERFRLRGHAQPVMCVAFSADGRRIATGSLDEVAKLWDADSGKELLTLVGHTGPISAVAFSGDGRTILTGSADNTAGIWDGSSGKELNRFKGHSTSVDGAALSPDGRWVVTASGDWMDSTDHTIRIWDARAREPLRLLGHSKGIQSVAFSPNGRWVATGSGDSTAKLWHALSGQELLTLRGHTGSVHCVVFSSDSRRIVTASGDRTVKIWEAVSGTELGTLSGHHDAVVAAAVSTDGQRILTGSFDGTVGIWDAGTAKKLLSLTPGIARIWSVAFSPDGRRCAAVGDLPMIKVWDVTTGKELLSFNGHRQIIVAVAFSPDGKRLITGSSDRTAKVWDLSTGKELLTLKGHGDQVVSAAFSPDGQRIITAGMFDRTAKLWNATSGEELLTLEAHTGAVRSAGFSPNGRQIVTGGWDGTAKIWDAATPEQVKDWQAEERAVAVPGPQ